MGGSVSEGSDSGPRLGDCSLLARTIEKSVADLLECKRLEPENPAGYANLVSVYALLNRLAEAKGVYDDLESHRVGNAGSHAN